MSQPWFEPEGFVIHEIDGSMAGFCWTKVHRDTDPVLGEIYVIAVDPAHAGHGLGRAMVVSGLVNLTERGVTTAMLFVDADNGAAMRLYGNLGFRVHRTDRAFVGDVPAKGNGSNSRPPPRTNPSPAGASATSTSRSTVVASVTPWN